MAPARPRLPRSAEPASCSGIPSAGSSFTIEVDLASQETITPQDIMLGPIGIQEILLLTLVLVLLFGAKRLPALARSLGRSRSEFSEGCREGDLEGNSPSKQS